MAVMDASIIVEMVVRTTTGLDAIDLAAAEPTGMHAPHLIDIEVMHTLRRLLRMGELTTRDAEFAVKAFQQLRLARHTQLQLLPRIWELRDSLSAYDAAYVALAEGLDMPLLTCDAKLARAPGHRAKIVLLS